MKAMDGSRICPTCLGNGPFYKNAAHHDGHTTYCVECSRLQKAKYRLEHKRPWKKRKPVHCHYRNRVCQVCQKSFVPTTSRQRRCLACAPVFNQKQENIYRANYRRVRPECRLVESAKATAKAKGLPFNLTSDYVRSIWNETCPVLGIRLKKGSGYRVDESPSLDRIVPARGYVIGNVHVISWRANRIKNNGTVEDLMKIAEYMSRLTRVKLQKTIEHPTWCVCVQCLTAG